MKLKQKEQLIFFVLGIARCQYRLKDSLARTWKNSLSNDWVVERKRQTFSLVEFYQPLQCVSLVKGAIENYKRNLSTIYDIFEINNPKEGTRAQKVLVTGRVMHYNKVKFLQK